MFQSQTCRYAQYQCIDLLLVFLPGFCESITHPAGPSLKFSGGHYFLWGLATKIWLHGLRKPEISEISISRSQQLGRHAILGTYGNHGLYDWHGLTDDIWWCWAVCCWCFLAVIKKPSETHLLFQEKLVKKHTTDYSKWDSLVQQQKDEEDEEEANQLWDFMGFHSCVSDSSYVALLSLLGMCMVIIHI